MPIMLSQLIDGTKNLYSLRQVAGLNSQDNMVNWVHMMEDVTTIDFIRGHELVVTTGMGIGTMDTEAWLNHFVDLLSSHNASGLIVNVGEYIQEIPHGSIAHADRMGFPIFTMPWEIRFVDSIKDFSNRIFMAEQSEADIEKALRTTIFFPHEAEAAFPKLIANQLVLDAQYRVASLSPWLTQKMEEDPRYRSVLAKALHKANIRHHIVRDSSASLLVIPVTDQEDDLRERMTMAAKGLQTGSTTADTAIGIGQVVNGVVNLHRSHNGALHAMRFARFNGVAIQLYDDLGVDRLLLAIPDAVLLQEVMQEALGTLLEYDRTHGTQYVQLLSTYLSNDCSVSIVSETHFMHRNTVNYHIRKIKEILGNDLRRADDKMQYALALRIYYRFRHEFGETGNERHGL